MKRTFGIIEVIFDISYMSLAFIIGLVLILSTKNFDVKMLSGIMAMILVFGDSFHLIPRIIIIRTGKENKLRKQLGRGKQITSISMTIFYLFIWHIGLIMFSPENITLWTYIIYILSLMRIILCLMPHNKWEKRYPPMIWGILRNIPFFLQGIISAGLYFIYRNRIDTFNLMWLAIILSFAFYLPVVLFANKNTKIGMLMFPKTCTYLWMLFICLSL